ncbi:ABC transporter substrate-binding protein [Hoyosella altamirensis]|uniref:ABC-type branched-subunit amino acid transport system substrate-binding protein n=1 Tax=Hoyosella altamirensis TaxID=616997 RepID=A0A839RU45_9ACTN|nr:ABC transporter substrate-binding protein [Hoyosella altamirensis]MBB3039738.1 ABC-type branched-subunit amino acid transport system substrate-binding protein [Hoyosella altamirensis]
MRSRSRRWGTTLIAAPAILALAAATACTAVDDEDDVTAGVGVTEEPCPDAVNADNGCIYLGVLSDLEGGPFAELGAQIHQGQLAFWRSVNEEGGIAGYDVDISRYTRNTAYSVDQHATEYQDIEPHVLALAMSLGTPQTESVLPSMDSSNLVAVPGSWWSGLHFDEADRGLILESGYSYCTESVIGLDWFSEEYGTPETLLTVGYPGDYGSDSAVGATRWAEANDVEILAQIDTAPNAMVQNQDAAVEQILSQQPDVVLIATAPGEAAEIVAKAVSRGYDGRFLGSVPTWNPRLLETAAIGALTARYNHVGPWQGWDGDSAALSAIRESLDGRLPDNQGYIFGWVWSYPLKSLLEAAADDGELSRSALRAAIDGLEVDYEGALPNRTFGEPPAFDEMSATISVPDAEVELGTRAIADGVTATTEVEYDAPCVQP